MGRIIWSRPEDLLISCSIFTYSSSPRRIPHFWRKENGEGGVALLLIFSSGRVLLSDGAVLKIRLLLPLAGPLCT